MKEAIPKCFWTFPALSMWGCPYWTTFDTPFNWVAKAGSLCILTYCSLWKFCIRTPKHLTVPYMSSGFSIICYTGVCGPRYHTRSAAYPCNEHTIPTHSVTSEWLYNTLFTSNTHCSNETFPFWAVSPLKILNLGVLPAVGGNTGRGYSAEWVLHWPKWLHISILSGCSIISTHLP